MNWISRRARCIPPAANASCASMGWKLTAVSKTCLPNSPRPTPAQLGPQWGRVGLNARGQTVDLGRHHSNLKKYSAVVSWGAKIAGLPGAARPATGGWSALSIVSVIAGVHDRGRANAPKLSADRRADQLRSGLPLILWCHLHGGEHARRRKEVDLGEAMMARAAGTKMEGRSVRNLQP